jgi:hypothetical protein
VGKAKAQPLGKVATPQGSEPDRSLLAVVVTLFLIVLSGATRQKYEYERDFIKKANNFSGLCLLVGADFDG